MRKFLIAIGVLAALAIPTVGIAADLHSAHIGSACKSADLRVWHFVNNQTEGATGGTLTAYFDSYPFNGIADITKTDSNPKVLKSVLHFNIYLAGDVRLLSATTGTSIPGNLVLSDFCKK